MNLLSRIFARTPSLRTRVVLATVIGAAIPVLIVGTVVWVGVTNDRKERLDRRLDEAAGFAIPFLPRGLDEIPRTFHDRDAIITVRRGDMIKSNSDVTLPKLDGNYADAYVHGVRYRVRTVEIPDRHLMGHHAAEAFTGKPGVEMKRRVFDLEGRLAQFREIEIDGVVGRGADCGGDAGKHRQRGAVNVAGGDQLHPRMTFYDRRQRAGIEEVLAVHVPDAGLEWRMMQEQQRRPVCGGCQRRVEPLQGCRIEVAMRFARYA